MPYMSSSWRLYSTAGSCLRRGPGQVHCGDDAASAAICRCALMQFASRVKVAFMGFVVALCRVATARPNHAFEGTRRGGRRVMRASVAGRPSAWRWAACPG